MLKFLNNSLEDIDVVLKSEVIGEDLEEIINLESKSQKEKMAEKLNTKAIEFYKTKLIPSIMNDLKKETDIPFKDKLEEKELAIYLEYPTKHSDSYIPNAVKLEIGPLAAWTPCESIKLSSFIAQKYPNLFVKPEFSVLITRPVRTFWAKFEEAVTGTFMLYPNEKSLPALRTDYDDMKNMMYGDIPDFEEVLSTIEKLESEINGLKE